MPGPRTVAGHRVGETACTVTGLTPVADVAGHPWIEATVAVSGTAAGYVETAGSPRADLTDEPNLLYPQFGDIAWAPAGTTYSGTGTGGPGTGNGLSVLWPDNPAAWNHRVLVVVPGQENVPPLGALVGRTPAGLSPNTFTNLYVGPAIDRGYAIIYLRRQAANGLSATLQDGRRVDTSLNDNVATVLDWIHTGEALLRQAGLADPASVLWYGHSSGVILGRLLNYSGANHAAGGGKVIDGFLSDDPGGGLPIPLTLPEGQVLGYRDGQITYPPGSGLTAAQRAQFTPEITLAHTLYLATHTWEPAANYLALKRADELAYLREGMAGVTRFYEVAGVSHLAAQLGSPPDTLDLEGLWLAVLSDLDSWVSRGIAPPANRADLNAGNDQPAAGQAVFLPPVACPTGYRFDDPPGADVTATGYVRYDGHSLEPLTAGGALIDINGDGLRDRLPTLDQAWQTAGLIAAGQHVDTAAYGACVQRDAALLVADRLLDPGVATWYVAQARQFPHVPW